MKSKAAVRRIVEELKVLYPNARCSLEYKKDYELLFAVRLSAQCTDARVNMVTPSLYQKFPTLEAFANATYEEVGDAIRSYCNTGDEDDRDPGRVGLSPDMFAAYTDGYLSQRARELCAAETDGGAHSPPRHRAQNGKPHPR